MKKQDSIPRPEHPRPQFLRPEWINLNGTWSYAFDPGLSGGERGLHLATGFPQKITVPFCPESPLSGVRHVDFIPAIWYHRTIRIPAAWRGRRVLLHFGAVDYECEAYVDGAPAGRHIGGAASFSFDITGLVKPGGTHHLVVHAVDDTRSGSQMLGKQSQSYHSAGCMYTRTTGIWQTVWLEAVHPQGLKAVHVIPDARGGSFAFIPTYHEIIPGQQFRVAVHDGAHVVAEERTDAAQGVAVAVKIPNPKLWSPCTPFLYDIVFQVIDQRGRVIDEAAGYAGMRTVDVAGSQVHLNGEPVYLRLVLDQGFYPDGIWTAPSDAALKGDIELAMRAGFNGARLHQKVFEERFHYWADRLGYLTWGESPSFGMKLPGGPAAYNFLNEWREIIQRDRNHPSLIAWTPFNETSGKRGSFDARLQCDAYHLAKALDPTRPVNDASGWSHTLTDLFTVHTYEQSPAKLRKSLAKTADGGVWAWAPQPQIAYAGQPYIVDEFGGIKWIPRRHRAFSDRSWGYGNAPESEQEFYARLEGLVDAILAHKHICGFCYTQLTDVEQEQNGIYNYNRTGKFDMKRIARIFRKTQPR